MFRSISSRRFSLPVLFATLLSASWLLTPEARPQVPAPTTTSNVALTAVLGKLKTQQDQLAANQTKIEAQTAQLKEEIRQAKIYSGRGGSRR